MRRIGASVDSSTLSFSGTKSSTENSTRPTGAPLGSMWAATDHRPRRDDFGRSIAWYSAPEAGRAQRVARELGAVGPLDDQRHRHVLERVGRVVAHHGHELHRLAGPIDAALGVEEGIDRAGQGAAVDAAVGEVERRLGELEPGEFLLGLASVTMTAAASAAPRPRSRPAGKVARPSAPVTALPIGSLPRDSSTTSRLGQRLGAVRASGRRR